MIIKLLFHPIITIQPIQKSSPIQFFNVSEHRILIIIANIKTLTIRKYVNTRNEFS